MVVVVQTEGVRVPEDVAQIRVLVADREASGDSAVYDQTVPLCTPTLTSNCYTLPLSAVLHPGAKQPNDTVRVQIDALSRSGAVVTASAALFSFSPKQSLRLDFVLYAACIGVVSCAERNQACGPDAMCTTLTPVKLDGEPDLGATGGDGGAADLSLPGEIGDLAAPPGSDLAATDMAQTSADLGVGMVDMALPVGTRDIGPIMSGDDGFVMMEAP
jgi:hypothetical protein